MAHTQTSKNKAAQRNKGDLTPPVVTELPREQTLAARVVGDVEFRQGDGPKQMIPHGPVEVHTTHNDATLSWEDGETRGSAAIPISDFKRYSASGAIVLKH